MPIGCCKGRGTDTKRLNAFVTARRCDKKPLEQRRKIFSRDFFKVHCLQQWSRVATVLSSLSDRLKGQCSYTELDSSETRKLWQLVDEPLKVTERTESAGGQFNFGNRSPPR